MILPTSPGLAVFAARGHDGAGAFEQDLSVSVEDVGGVTQVVGGGVHQILAGVVRRDTINSCRSWYGNPTDGLYSTDSDWVHAVEVREAQRTLYVSGTMGLEADGEPGASLDRQLDLIWSNISTILSSADMTVDNIVRVTSYLRDASYAGANAGARVKAVGGRAVASTAIVAETLLSEWLVEIEAIAAA